MLDTLISIFSLHAYTAHISTSSQHHHAIYNLKTVIIEAEKAHVDWDQ